MKNTIIAAIVLTVLGLSFSAFTNNSSCETAIKNNSLVGLIVHTNAENTTGTYAGPSSGSFKVNGTGVIHGPAGYYCICVGATGGGYVQGVYYNGLYGDVDVNNGQFCNGANCSY